VEVHLTAESLDVKGFLLSIQANPRCLSIARDNVDPASNDAVTSVAMHFEIVGELSRIEVIATGSGVRERRRLWKVYGRGW
jgi:hypothetical protein